MAMQEIRVRLSPQMARELNSLALEKKSKRERVLNRLVKEALRRESARKQANPKWQSAFQDIQRVRASVPRVPAKELARDIQYLRQKIFNPRIARIFANFCLSIRVIRGLKNSGSQFGEGIGYSSGVGCGASTRSISMTDATVTQPVHKKIPVSPPTRKPGFVCLLSTVY